MPWQKIRLWLAILGLVALSVAGFWGVDQEWRYAASLGEKFSTFMQTAYAVLGVLVIVPIWRRQRWARASLYLWAFTMVMTGATAPVIWGHAGWWAGVFAACLTGVFGGVVILLAPLPPPQGAMKLGRWLVAALVAVAALVVLGVMVPKVAPLAPLALHGEQMESFCSGLPAGLTRDQLAAMADKQGYIATPGHDDKGDFLKLTDDVYRGQYYCEARFKPDGTIARMNFTAGAKN